MRSTQSERWKITDENQFRRHIPALSWGSASDRGQHFYRRLLHATEPAPPDFWVRACPWDCGCGSSPSGCAVSRVCRFIPLICVKMLLPWAWGSLLLGRCLTVPAPPGCITPRCMLIAVRWKNQRWYQVLMEIL